MVTLDRVGTIKPTENPAKKPLLIASIPNYERAKDSTSSNLALQEKTAVEREFNAALTETANHFADPAQSPSARYDSWYSRIEFPEYYTELVGYRDAFVGVLEKARDVGGEDNPIGFLETLSPLELRALQKHHGLGDPIDPSKLDFEGAVNLLRLPDEARDINRDGLIGRGIGHSVQFPPPDAPREVIDAWNEATKGLDWHAKATMDFSMWLRAGGQNVILNESSGKLQSQGASRRMAPSVPYLSESFDWREFALSMISFEAENARYNTSDTQRGMHHLRLSTFEKFFNGMSSSETR